jgi:hypothetical protein
MFPIDVLRFSEFRIECGRSWVRIKEKTIKLVFTGSTLSMQHKGEDPELESLSDWVRTIRSLVQGRIQKNSKIVLIVDLSLYLKTKKFQEIRIIATGPCIANQLRDVNTICRRSWDIAAHVWKIYDFKR